MASPLTYNPSIDSIVLARAVGALYYAVDGRSTYPDTDRFVRRPFQSLEFVKSYFNIEEFRRGMFSIYVNETGELNESTGYLEGGITKEYWWKEEDLSNDGLVEKSIDLTPYATLVYVDEQIAPLVVQLGEVDDQLQELTDDLVQETTDRQAGDLSNTTAIESETARAIAVENTKANSVDIKSNVKITFADLTTNTYTNLAFSGQTVDILYSNPTVSTPGKLTFNSSGIATMPVTAVSGFEATLLGVAGVLNNYLRIDELSANSKYPFNESSTAPLASDWGHGVLDIQLNFTDVTKQYYISLIGNYYDAGSERRNYLQISEVGGGLVAGGMNRQGFWVVTAPKTGVELVTLYNNVTVVVGYALINWDKIFPAGGRATVISSVGLLHKNVIYNRKYTPNSEPPKYAKWPFSVNSTLNFEYPDIFSAIDRIVLSGADVTKRYYLRSIGRNRPTGSPGAYQIVIEVVGSASTSGVCSFTGSIAENASGINVVNLAMTGVSGVTGLVYINWNKITSTSFNPITFSASQSEISTDVYYTTGDVPKFSKTPFSPIATINIDAPDIYQAFDRIELYGADQTKKYYIKAVARNRPAGNVGFYQVVIEEEGVVSAAGVCLYNALLTENPSGVNVIELTTASGSEISGKAWVNWKRMSNLAFNPIGYTVSQTELSSEVHQPMPQPGTSFDEETDRLLVADSLYLVDEDNLQFCKNAMITSEYYKGELGIMTNELDPSFSDWFSFTHKIQANKYSNGNTVRIFNKPVPLTMYYKDVIVNKVAKSTLAGKSANIILFGDSITDGLGPGLTRAVTPWVAENLISWGVTPLFNGLLTDSGYKNEGRRSWEYADAIGLNTANPSGAVGLPTDTASTSLTAQPFTKIATTDQLTNNPTWCFENTKVVTGTGVFRELNYTESQTIGTYTGDYYTFDFERYADLNLGGSIDPSKKLIVCSAFGFNDMNHNEETEQAKLDVLLGMEIFYGRIKEYRSDAIVGFAPVVIVNESNNWPEYANLLERAQLKANELGADIVPVWQHVDRYAAFNYATATDLSATNNSKKGTSSDVVHPTTFGTRQYANVVSNWIANKL